MIPVPPGTNPLADKVAEYSNKAAELLRKAEPMLTRTDSRPAPQLIAAAGVWAQLAQVAALAGPVSDGLKEDSDPLAGYDIPDLP